jgi:hypothetical protein
MRLSRSLIVIGFVLQGGFALAQGQDEFQGDEYRALVAAMPTAKHTLLDGINQVAIGDAIPNEAKFEMEDGKLMLSVYTSQKGLGVVAEDNVFDEFKGDATADAWEPEQEVFEDLQHIARSAQYHTLLSMTGMTIPQVMRRCKGKAPP